MVQGLAEFERRWSAIPDRVRQAVVREMETVADEIVAAMRRAAPRKQGKLAASIGWTFGEAPEGSLTIGKTSGGKAYGSIVVTFYAGNQATIVTNKSGARFQNARLQEFGTTAQPANPFFYPIWRIWRKRARARILAAARRAIAAA